MIYLKSRNIIFIKPRKTAGTSVEIALSANACEDDIITPVSPEDELLRLAAPFQFPVNWATDKMSEDQYYRSVCTMDKTGNITGLFQLLEKKARFFNHMRQEQIEQEIGSALFAKAYKISMLRHPYEQLISQAYWRSSQPGASSFISQIEYLLCHSELANSGIYFNATGTKIDFLIRYEELYKDLESLEQAFDLELIKYLPKTKHRSRTDRRPAHQILSEDQKKRCFRRNEREFVEFGYEKHF